MHRRAWTTLAAGSVAWLASCSGCEVEEVQDTPGTLVGTLCHQVTGRPSVGAVVKVTTQSEGRSTELETTTDDQGAFEIANVPPGPSHVEFSGEGVSGRSDNVTIESEKITTWTDPRCLDPGSLLGRGCVAGQVCNRHTGMFVSSAQVTVVLTNVDSATLDTNLSATTSSDGVFQICEVPEGTHTVSVRAEGFQKAYVAEVTPGQTTEVTSAPQCQAYDPAQHCRVRGRVCTSETPPGWLPDARVTAVLLDSNGMPATPLITEVEPEYTDGDGRYELYLKPSGRWRVNVQKGNFVDQHDVDCVVNEITEIPEGTQCVTAGECRFMAVQGVFDRVEDVLGRVGVPSDRIDMVDGNPALGFDWAFQAFGVYETLAPYCGIFINCGVDESGFTGPTANPQVLANLRRFVEEGGTLYASDQSYDILEALYPAKVDWYRNDDLGSDAEFGLPGMITANVEDDGLRTFLQQETPGQDTVTINFAYQSWALLQSIDVDVQVFLRANVQACADGEACTTSVLLQGTPLTVRWPVGTNGGQVIFTSFHLETRQVGDGGMVISTEDTDRVMRFLMTL